MKANSILLTLGFAFVAGCCHEPRSPNSFTVAQIVESAATLEGRTVTVVGYLRFGDDSHNLWNSRDAFVAARDNKPPSRAGGIGGCITLYDLGSWREVLMRNDQATVQISGVVYRIPREEEEIAIGECSDLGVAIRSIRRLR